MSTTRETVSTTYYHGAHASATYWRPHVGLCLTDDRDAAERYAGRNGTVYEITLPDTLTVLDSDDGYDHESNSCRWDDEAELAACGHDVVRYDDEDEYGRHLVCWRLASQTAVDAAEVAE